VRDLHLADGPHATFKLSYQQGRNAMGWGDILVADADGKHPRKLALGYWPFLNAAGTHLAFAHGPRGASHIRVLELKSGDEEEWNSAAGAATDPALSRDGKLLAYSVMSGGKSQIAILNLAQARATATGVRDGDGVIHLAFPPALIATPANARFPTLSADGSSVVFTHTRSKPDDKKCDRDVVRADLSTGAQSVLQRPDAVGCPDDPALSLDGRKLAFSRGATHRTGWHVFVVDLEDLAHPRQVTSGPDEFAPQFTEDGSLLFSGRHARQPGGDTIDESDDGIDQIPATHLTDGTYKVTTLVRGRGPLFRPTLGRADSGY
jgi:Tol biopolymer transport system component